MKATLRDHEEDIVEWADRLSSYIRFSDLERFEKDTLLQDAVIRCLIVIGEAASRTLRENPEHREATSLLGAYRMRNVLAHGYDVVRLETVWQTATHSVPDLADRLRDPSKFGGESA